MISNHDTKFTREIYNGAKFKRVKVQRSISQNPEKRVKVKELIAIFGVRK
ncbi:DNA adenine methylase [Haemophilus influenzae 22.4-21]|uniref:DNA adenine methylase n=1 Tax=Haemophilus influenzae 22.4-21 TaxID=375063 RepID=A4NYW6_HAEIF|nr:DNA adenine methylase [Haemophilus influenzae 22.4-21]